MKAIKKVSPIMGLWSQYAAIVVFVAMSTLRNKTSFATALESNNGSLPKSIFAKASANVISAMSPISASFSNRNMRSNSTKEASLNNDNLVDTNKMNITVLLNATTIESNMTQVTNMSHRFNDNVTFPVEAFPVEDPAEITTEYYSTQNAESEIKSLLDGSVIDGADEYIQPLIALPYSPPYTPPIPPGANCPTNSPSSAPRRTHSPIEFVIQNPTHVPFSWPTSKPTSSPTPSPTPSSTLSPTSIPRIHFTQRPWYLPRPTFMPIDNALHSPPKSDSSNHPPRPAPWIAPNGPAYPTQYYPLPRPTQCCRAPRPTQCCIVPQPRCCRPPFDCSWCKFYDDRTSCCNTNPCVDKRYFNVDNRKFYWD